MPVMVIDSRQVADQDENMNVPGRKRGFRIGVGAVAALCAVLISLTSVSGCTVFVVGSTPRNPFLGEWHAEFKSAGSRFSAEYEFKNNRRYTYLRQSSSGVVRVIISTRGTYDYDDKTLLLTPDADDVNPSRFRYEFTEDGDALELEERISTSVTLVLIYHRPICSAPVPVDADALGDRFAEDGYVIVRGAYADQVREPAADLRRGARAVRHHRDRGQPAERPPLLGQRPYADPPQSPRLPQRPAGGLGHRAERRGRRGRGGGCHGDPGRAAAVHAVQPLLRAAARIVGGRLAPRLPSTTSSTCVRTRTPSASS